MTTPESKPVPPRLFALPWTPSAWIPNELIRLARDRSAAFSDEYIPLTEHESLLSEARLDVGDRSLLLNEIREFLMGLVVRCDVMDKEFYEKVVDRSHTRMVRGQASLLLEKLPIGDACAEKSRAGERGE